MDEAFEKLCQQGKNTQETVLKWMREANIVADQQQEQKAKDYFKQSGSSDSVDLNQLKHVLEEIAKDKRKEVAELQVSFSAQSEKLMGMLRASAQQIETRAVESIDKMEEAFEKLRKEGKNDQETLLNWMKEAKIIADKKQEDLAKQYFKETAEAKVDMDRFKEVIGRVANDSEKTIEDLQASLSATSAKLMKAVQSGVNAFKDAMKKLE